MVNRYCPISYYDCFGCQYHIVGDCLYDPFADAVEDALDKGLITVEVSDV